MSVGVRTIERLEELLESEGLSIDPQRPVLIGTQGGPISVEAQILDFNRVGCSFTEMTVWGTEPVSADFSVKARAEQVDATVSYLMERLRPVEIDEAGGRAQLRSTSPRQVDGSIEYYEAFLSRRADGVCQVHVARYRQDADAQRRSTVPLNLTREVLERLLDDLAEILNPVTVQEDW